MNLLFLERSMATLINFLLHLIHSEPIEEEDGLQDVHLFTSIFLQIPSYTMDICESLIIY
jgi:hypothetical protein